MNYVRDLMTKKVISVQPETPLLEASQILFNKKVGGLPVVDKKNKVIGILTEYDLVTKGTQIHLPTFLKLFHDIDLYRQDKTFIRDELKKMLALRVSDVMNREPFTLRPEATIEEAARAFAEHHRVNPIVIVDQEHNLAGVLSRCDLLRLYVGGKPASFQPSDSERDLDQKVDHFVQSFEREFVFVSKFRTHFWLIISILFAIVGFIIAFAFIVTIGPQ